MYSEKISTQLRVHTYMGDMMRYVMSKLGRKRILCYPLSNRKFLIYSHNKYFAINGKVVKYTYIL